MPQLVGYALVKNASTKLMLTSIVQVHLIAGRFDMLLLL